MNYMQTSIAPQDPDLADRLILASVRLGRTLRARDVGAKLPGPLSSALAVVVHSGRISLGDLAAMERVGRPAIPKVAKALQDAGLVRRDVDPDDRRMHWLSPTPAGVALLTEGQARHAAPLAADIARLSAADAAVLSRAVELIEQLIAPR